MNLGIVKLTSKRYDDSIFSYMVENIKDYFDQVLILSDWEKAEEKHSALEFENVFFESALLKKKILQYDTINICLPLDKLIDQFNKIIYPMINKMQEIILENQELSSLRDFLLPLLMNGQIGFKD